MLVIKVILPGLNPSSQYDYSDQLDVGAVLADPFGHVAEILQNDQKMETLLLVLMTSAFLVFRSPIGLAIIPTLAWRFLSNNEGHWGHTWHYSLVLMPLLFGAVIDGAARLTRSPHGFWRRAGDLVPVIVLTFAITKAPTLPMWQLTDPDHWRGDPARIAAAEAAVASVGSGRVVATDIGLMNHLVDANDVYYVGQSGNPVADVVVIDQRHGGWNMEFDVADYAAGLYPGTQWEITFEDAGYVVADRS